MASHSSLPSLLINYNISFPKIYTATIPYQLQKKINQTQNMHDAQFTFIQILTELILLMIFIQHVPGYLPTY